VHFVVGSLVGSILPSFPPLTILLVGRQIRLASFAGPKLQL